MAARTIFSTRFLTSPGLLGRSSSWIVDEGTVVIVKQLTAYMSSSGPTIRVWLEDDATGAALWSCASPSSSVGLPEPAWFGFYGALVFEAGQSFSFRVLQEPGLDGAYVYAGGYLLAA